MARRRAEEEWARSIIAMALDADVQIHDTGNAPGQYDLAISYSDGTVAAGEVVAAADPESIALWRVVNDDREERWQVEGLVGGWNVSLDPQARGKRVIAELPGICRRLETHGIKDIRHAVDASYEFALSMGIRGVRQLPTDFPGSIYVMIDLPSERTGGMVPQNGDPLSEWLGEFLAGVELEDVRGKLGRSGLAERHAVVFVPSLSIAPFPVVDLLFGSDAPHPEVSPLLPEEITHVWAFSSWTSGQAFHWSPGRGWARFPKF